MAPRRAGTDESDTTADHRRGGECLGAFLVALGEALDRKGRRGGVVQRRRVPVVVGAAEDLRQHFLAVEDARDLLHRPVATSCAAPHADSARDGRRSRPPQPTSGPCAGIGACRAAWSPNDAERKPAICSAPCGTGPLAAAAAATAAPACGRAAGGCLLQHARVADDLGERLHTQSLSGRRCAGVRTGLSRLWPFDPIGHRLPRLLGIARSSRDRRMCHEATCGTCRRNMQRPTCAMRGAAYETARAARPPAARDACHARSAERPPGWPAPAAG